ncbi:hypothetical protein ASPACDRAFT_63354 [Aspergillus aculeatus ATCC 16872]|uniref:N-acetyltransferase domain-containing protein n=1 Tax=Aspergillus aculeatus (strain ATCC 16872 / CBS 172.66 / WB 5094) TaxID=690307 RepID=A0A1L9WJT9_ASPA1|nr:uncharacterized protein ASPACDRAFT_63354 [Aspergillus aculeatus ATCC 16872]OJJ96420.1 hypothetical protein ASPACDRAFT_63354 [Aspergillus aculeatus ATCC 16872]
MTSVNPTISRIESSDLPFLAEFIHSAKLSLSINRLLYQPWPNETVQRKQYTGAVEGAFADASMECFKATTEGDLNAIIGYMVLAKKTATKQDPLAPVPAKSVPPDNLPSAPEGMNPGVLAEVSAANVEVGRATENIDRYELIYMCVEPSYQRQGVGSRLLQLGFDRARAESLPLAVTAEAPAYGFFETLGFRETKHVDIDLRKYASANSGFGIFRLTGMMWRP